MVCNMDIVNGKRVSGLDNMFFDPFNSFLILGLVVGFGRPVKL